MVDVKCKSKIDGVSAAEWYNSTWDNIQISNDGQLCRILNMVSLYHSNKLPAVISLCGLFPV